MIPRDVLLLGELALFYWAGAYVLYRHVENALIRYGVLSYPIYLVAIVAGTIIGSQLGALK